MNFILFFLSVMLGWFGGQKAYHYWLSKRYWKILSKLGAVSVGFFITIFAFSFLTQIFNTMLTAILFIFVSLFTWVGFKYPHLLRLKPSGRLLTRTQLSSFFGVSTFLLAVFGSTPVTDTNNVSSSNVPQPVVTQNINKTVENDHSQDNPFNDGNASLTVENSQVASMTQKEPSAGVNVAAEPQPIVDSEEETTVFHEQDNNSCGGLPSRCTEMRDCKQAYQALECGNSRLDRDDDGIPCESICG